MYQAAHDAQDRYIRITDVVLFYIRKSAFCSFKAGMVNLIYHNMNYI